MTKMFALLATILLAFSLSFAPTARFEKMPDGQPDGWFHRNVTSAARCERSSHAKGGHASLAR
jgi:hypothetical protein